MGSIDDYLGGLDERQRAVFQRVLDVAVEVAPDAVQGTSYGIPALIWRGKPLLGFRASPAHLAVYPFGSSAVDAVRDGLSGYSLSKGTVRFEADHPLPEQAIRRMVSVRRDEIRATGD